MKSKAIKILMWLVSAVLLIVTVGVVRKRWLRDSKGKAYNEPEAALVLSQHASERTESAARAFTSAKEASRIANKEAARVRSLRGSELTQEWNAYLKSGALALALCFCSTAAYADDALRLEVNGVPGIWFAEEDAAFILSQLRQGDVCMDSVLPKMRTAYDRQREANDSLNAALKTMESVNVQLANERDDAVRKSLRHDVWWRRSYFWLPVGIVAGGLTTFAITR